MLRGKVGGEVRGFFGFAPRHSKVDNATEGVAHQWTVRLRGIIPIVLGDVRPSFAQTLHIRTNAWRRCLRKIARFHPVHELLINHRSVSVRGGAVAFPHGKVVAPADTFPWGRSSGWLGETPHGGIG